MSLITFDNIQVFFGPFQVLKDINFSVNKGEFLHILGPNGSGKTTLIKLLTGSLKPTSGTVNIQEVTKGYLPQKLTFNSKIPLTVFEVIYSGFPHPKLIPSKAENALIDQWLNKMEIYPLKHKSVITISGGQQQRVYLIRALVSNPQLIILDEPTSALDPSFREKFYDMLKEIQMQQGATVIHVTHDLTDVVKDGDYTLYIDQEIKFFGTYAQYKTFEHLGHHHD